ncbi:transcription factor bHLH81-like isoform X2 [Miscanthus floridulus]|uniref:transcription factor bHLH81-like isoform X2 n=2 Tax=Miscanthus floridulus TaxID=154761 RepID=UPI00345915BF
MNPPPQRGGRSRYGPAAQQAGQQQQQQYPFIVDPTEAAGAAVRAFFPAPGAGEPPPPPSSSAAERARSTMQHGHHHYGGGAPEISLAAHGHGQGHHGIHHHRYHQFGVEGRQDGGGPSSSVSLPRHSSSPPGFFSSPVVDNGFPSARAGVGGEVHHAMSGYHKKMKSPMNLSRQGALSQFSEDGIPDDLTNNNVHGIGHSEENITANNVARSFSSGFSIGSWEDSNSIVFSNPASKAGIHNNDDIIASISNSYELQFGVAKEMAGLLQRQQDQVPFRVRAKRGCATHPRSIAERERRTRISEKLRKLQALVPNMDKQTSTADMLDLAVDHIRGLQSELQALKEDKEKCTCRGNRPPGR